MNNFQLIEEFIIYFSHEDYDIAIKNIREALDGTNLDTFKNWLKENWLRLVSFVKERKLAPGEPMALTVAANVLLYENTDEEAYKWLDLTVYNVERTDGKIEYYHNSFLLK